jgi:general L-amino acid transport system substrate-binding protein
MKVYHLIVGCAGRGIAASLLALLASSIPLAAQTVARIRATNTLRCATISEIPEYSSSDDHGPRTAFDTDLCRAVAIAILGPQGHTVITTYPDDIAASAALRARKVDLIPSLTVDLTHTAPAVTFSPPVFYDGVGFLVPTGSGFAQPDALSGKKICFLAATHVENSLRMWFAHEQLIFVPFPFNEEGEMEAAFVTGNCAALAGDLTRLAFVRLNFGPIASRYSFMPAKLTALDGSLGALEIAPDPLAAASPSSDPAFANIVRWTFEALLNAEACGLTRHTPAPSKPFPDDDCASVLTGRTHEIGTRLGLRNSWAQEVIAATGSYGEIFKRDLGEESPLKLPREQNRLAGDGGLMLPLPLK